MPEGLKSHEPVPDTRTSSKMSASESKVIAVPPALTKRLPRAAPTLERSLHLACSTAIGLPPVSASRSSYSVPSGETNVRRVRVYLYIGLVRLQTTGQASHVFLTTV